jgi:hypothetical protein
VKIFLPEVTLSAESPKSSYKFTKLSKKKEIKEKIKKPEAGGACLDRRLDRRFFFFSLSPSQFTADVSTTDC